MRPQRLHRRVVSRQFRLAQRLVDRAVADVVQQHRLAALAAAQLGDQVVAALRDARRDRAQAQGAGGVVVGHGRDQRPGCAPGAIALRGAGARA